MEDLIQAAIVMCSASSIWLLGRKDRTRRFGFWCSLAGQPFWFYTAASKGQWGVLILCCWFTVCNVRGIWNHRPV